MCTVTFVPAKENIYLTSNRDEHHTRSSAIFPEKYAEAFGKIIYPKDKDKGGSWVAMKSTGDAAVLLNGAFEKHERIGPYCKSRGLIFVEIIKAKDPIGCFQQMGLNGIEPFTVIIFFGRQLHECIWDGKRKYSSQLNPAKAHIWSSATLYDEAARKERKKWFVNWQQKTNEIDTKNILEFHQHAGNHDAENGLVINRNGVMQTVSITSIKLSRSKASMTYLDLRNKKRSSENIRVLSSTKMIRTNRDLFIRKLLIRTFNREYWPHHLVYAPLYLYWFWLSLRARSFFFFNTSNPLIKNGGFLMESKKEIYDLMPAALYPKTIFCQFDTDMCHLKKMMQDNDLRFPIIAKPDIGLQGFQVELLHDERDLMDYSKKNKVDFLLQEFVDYENEAGIFYYRIPGEKRGKISGIVGKEFIQVIGDGRSTIEELLLKEERYILQFNNLRACFGEDLQAILPAKAGKILAHYGNHRRGAKFIDLTQKANKQLNDTINNICNQIPEFYYGRLDIKFKSWEDLCAGLNFSIIELNGAGSEPTHIYDPKHSLFFVWKEIVGHWGLLFRISKLNAKQKGIRFMSTNDGLKMFNDNNQYLKLISK